MDISQITDYLYIASQLKNEDLPAIEALDVRLIINMIAHRRVSSELTQPPRTVVWLRTFDFFLLPIPVKTLYRGVRAALPVIQDGHRVLVYCQAGRHRSVAMASAILIARGYAAQEAMDLVKERRAVADPDARHIRRQIEKFEVYWHKQSQSKGESDT
ncbi:MAG: dual specificity protein phosphatase family protein [Anaerolineae bacterium]|jgi:protein tyrosine phosphatase (PTP) superfamily phosphohydrolase (DUF442 family)